MKSLQEQKRIISAQAENNIRKERLLKISYENLPLNQRITSPKKVKALEDCFKMDRELEIDRLNNK